ncbi:CNP1-like family protein [Cupriavidus gilardii J11]|uniref:CNP1-like family protein n=1 Tax=Cupriavidus gilardii J11 TaxID=936133 RepID=A0A562B0S1_9BURK|nr:CNP1-like family protein [Cupriavidus gilardii]TWG78775.1 CNP1-like family protein [Cupriavidus gilardii J11]
MTNPAGFGRRFRPGRQRALAMTAGLFAIATLTACSSTPQIEREMPVDDQEPVFLLDRLASKGFNEAPTKLPAPPAEADLIPFEVGTTGRLSFAVDAKSIVVGEDGAVRYTVVVSSPSGARNISHEGVRCDTFQRKLFATMPPGSKQWVPNSSVGAEQWRRMDPGVRNSYAANLAIDYLCEGRTVAGKAEDIVRTLRDGTPRSAARFQ